MSGTQATGATGATGTQATGAIGTQTTSPGTQIARTPSIQFPPSIGMELLDGANWDIWSVRMLAVLRLNGLRPHVLGPANPSDPAWDMTEQMPLGVFEVYTHKNVWSVVADDTKFPSCKEKWDELARIYEDAAQDNRKAEHVVF